MRKGTTALERKRTPGWALSGWRTGALGEDRGVSWSIDRPGEGRREAREDPACTKRCPGHWTLPPRGPPQLRGPQACWHCLLHVASRTLRQSKGRGRRDGRLRHSLCQGLSGVKPLPLSWEAFSPLPLCPSWRIPTSVSF